MLPVANPIFDGREKENLISAIESGWVSWKGPFVEQFEDKLSKILQQKYVIAVSNGTAALHLALKAIEVVHDKIFEVYVPDFTFAATAYAAYYLNGPPNVVDVEPHAWSLDVYELRKSFRKYQSPSLIYLPVAISGFGWDIEELEQLASETESPIVGDLCQALGSTYNDKPLSNYCDISCYSFFANKMITTGEGGAVATNNKEYADIIRKLMSQGIYGDNPNSNPYMSPLKDEAYNYRFTNLQAAVGVAQLDKLEQKVIEHKACCAIYREALGDEKLSGLGLSFQVPLSIFHNPSEWMFRLRTQTFEDAYKLHNALSAEEIESKYLYPPLHEQTFMDLDKDICEHYSHIYGIYLPTGGHVSAGDIERIANIIERTLKNA